MDLKRPPNHMRVTNLQKFLFGAPYYPEHWTEADMAEDPRRMAAAGFNVVRMGEFAWDRMEPSPGRYDFNFFDDHIDRLGKAGISTILCTPTATPPRWLTYGHPDVLRVNSQGIQQQHGSRQHACHSSRKFREFGNAVTRAMADHYKENPHVIGWQTDNELFCHFVECYCDNCLKAFKAWLEKKYGSIEELNKAWGTSFWALTYGSFDEVNLPYPGRPTHSNPTHVLDYSLFLSDEVIGFQREQVEILRAANPQWFITHNGYFRNIDYRKFCEDLDFFGVDVYPLFSGAQWRPAGIAYQLDAARSFAGNFIIPEQQSGPGGQGDYFHDQPQPGQIRLWSYQGIARGCDSLLHFRWRTCRFGAEQYWCGVLDHDNKPRRRYEEVSREGREFARIGDDLLGTHIRPDVGILYDTGLEEMGHRPITLGLPSPDQCARMAHQALYKSGYSVGLVHPDDGFDTFKLLILPSWPIVTGGLAKKLEDYVEAGGVLLVGGRSGVKNEKSHVIAETLPGLLRKVTGLEIGEYRRINEPGVFPNRILWEGADIGQHMWLESLNPTTAEVMGRWSDGMEKGAPAMARNKLGRGWCLYAGTLLTADGVSALMPCLSRLAGIGPMVADCPEGVEVSIRECADYKLWFILNHNGFRADVPNLPKGVDILSGDPVSGDLTLDGYGVAVVKEVL